MTQGAEIWDSNQLWLKALLFMERVHERGPLDEEAMLWRCVSLELLARSVLTQTHPVLNADPGQEGVHVLFACGFETAKQPRSVPAHAVFARLKKMYPDFEGHSSACEYLTTLRNEELHTARQPFAEMEEPSWLATYYEAVVFLCQKLGKEPAEYLGDELAHAKELMEKADQELTANVHRRIHKCQTAFVALPDDQRAALAEQSHRLYQYRSEAAKCPSCELYGVLGGNWLKSGRPVYDEGEVSEPNTYRTTSFDCSFCGLQLKSMKECVVGKLPLQFEVLEGVDLHDMHQDQDYMEYDNM